MADKQELVGGTGGMPSAPNYEERSYPSTAAPPAYTPQNYPQNYNPTQGVVYTQQYPADPHFQHAGLHDQPQQVMIIRQAQLPFKDYTNLALVVTICCCLPFGIVGLVKASEAKNLHLAGNQVAAAETASSAGTWTKAGLIFGIIIYGLFIALCIIWVAVVASLDYDDDWD